MAESSDRRAATRAAQADLDAALRDRVAVQLSPILAEVMAALRAGGLPAGQRLWRAIGIVEAAMTTIQQRARTLPPPEAERCGGTAAGASAHGPVP